MYAFGGNIGQGRWRYHGDFVVTRVNARHAVRIRPFGELPNVCATCGKVGTRRDRNESLLVQRVNRRERRKEQTVRRIEKAAWTLFTTRGYEATSTRDIADAADIAAGTLFNYFPEKRSLLIHLMQRQI